MEPQEKEPVVAQPEVVSQEQNTPVVETPQEDSPEQINWRKFREQREVERKQKEEALRKAAEKEAEASALKAAMESLLNKNQRQEYSNQEEDLSEDERIEKKVQAALLQREAKLETEKRQREQAEFPQRLVQTYSDFHQVCSPENIDYLEFHYPEVAEAFKHAPDGFDKWSAVYKAVKRFIPNTSSKKEQSKVQNNLNKPQSMAAPGVTQTSDTAPMFLDEKRKADNWSRMQKVMKGGG